MPIYLGNTEIGSEFYGSAQIGNLYLGNALISPVINPFFNASGGQITSYGDYIVHTFTSSANLNVINIGLSPFNQIDYLIVGGGGGGGRGRGTGVVGGAGGASGVVRTGSITPNPVSSSYSVTIGLGGIGVGSAVTTNPGGTSSFGGIIATGGNAFTQGSSNLQGGSNTDFLGGTGDNYFTIVYVCGGGAGAGADGTNGLITGNPEGGVFANGGSGGNGIQSSINGTATYYGGGGAAASGPGAVTGSAGLGGGGVSGPGGCFTKPAAATANSGGGGGGNGDSNCIQTSGDGGDGASGIVILRYKYK